MSIYLAWFSFEKHLAISVIMSFLCYLQHCMLVLCTDVITETLIYIQCIHPNHNNAVIAFQDPCRGEMDVQSGPFDILRLTVLLSTCSATYIP